MHITHRTQGNIKTPINRISHHDSDRDTNYLLRIITPHVINHHKMFLFDSDLWSEFKVKIPQSVQNE